MLEKQKIIIVGAGGLLGCNTVRALLDAGAEVIATDIEIEPMTRQLSEHGVSLKHPALSAKALNVCDSAAVKKFFDTNLGLTGAVNTSYPRNANYGAHFFDVSLSSFNENVSLHLGSAFLFTQQCALYFQKHQTPLSLVNIASIYGVVPPRFRIYENTQMTAPVEYAAIKAAIIHLNKYVSSYINDSRFRVNSISPGGAI